MCDRAEIFLSGIAGMAVSRPSRPLQAQIEQCLAEGFANRPRRGPLTLQEPGRRSPKLSLLDQSIDDLHAPIFPGERNGSILELRFSVADSDQRRRRQIKLLNQQPLYRLGSALR